jgi:hypothetical protein
VGPRAGEQPRLGWNLTEEVIAELEEDESDTDLLSDDRW